MIPVIVLAVLLGAAAAACAVLAGAAMATSTITLAEGGTKRGELLNADYGERQEAVVVRRVMTDLTRAHVVLVRPWKPWHRWGWTRRWL